MQFSGKISKTFWLDLHRWVGLKLSLLLCFVLITGTLATVSHEIDWLLDEDRRVWPPVAETNYDWQSLTEAAQQARQDWSFMWVSAPIDPWFAAEAVGITPGGVRRRLFIHPTNFTLQGEGGWFNTQRLLRDIHRRLLIFHPLGIAAVSALGFLMLLSFVTSFFVYKKFWRGFFKMPRLAPVRILWGDLHRLAGVWSLWFTLLIALTCVWYFVESTGAMAGIRVGPMPKVSPASEARAEAGAASIDAMVQTISITSPDFKIRRILMPAFDGDDIIFQGQHTAMLTRDRANSFTFNSATGALKYSVDGSDLDVPQRISEMADPLHFGTFGGLLTKLIWFVFGVALSGMALSGVYIYSLRMRHRAKNRPPQKQADAGSPQQQGAVQ